MNSKHKPWTPDEIRTLEAAYRTTTAIKLGEMLGRSRASVRMKINEIGLVKKFPPMKPRAAPRPKPKKATSIDNSQGLVAECKQHKSSTGGTIIRTATGVIHLARK
jgi:hypothetical protein